MPLITDTSQQEKLRKYNINIKTKYIVSNNILERNTDNSYNDDIKSGIICEKEYYQSNKLLHKEKLFDSRIEYTFINKDIENKQFECPNCGMEESLDKFIDGCPYCKTKYNIDYSIKDLGSKYHYDRVLKSNIYKIITALIDIIISFTISYFYIKMTSRTFNNFDVLKILIYGLIIALILYYFFYIIDGYIVLYPIKLYKDRENKKQIDFWNRTKIDKKTFFNNLNYEIRNYYYKKDNIIDYDILDFNSFKEYYKNDYLYVDIKANVRIIYYINNKIKTKTINTKYTMKKICDNSLKLKAGANLIKCHNCGSAIDITKGKCDYCNTKVNYYQNWILDLNKDL